MNYQVCWTYDDIKNEPIWFAQFFETEKDAREQYTYKKGCPGCQLVKILKIGAK